MRYTTPHVSPSLISQAFHLAALTINSGHALTLYNFPALHLVNGNACSSIAHNVFYNTEMN